MGVDKPSLAYFRRCIAAVEGFDPETAVIVGDSLTSDIRGGRNAGIRTCWFNPRRKAANPELAPDFEFHALSELPALLETL
jgi:2-haloacid dehalogenase